MGNERRFELGRRGFLGAAGSLAGVSLLGGASAQAFAQSTGARSAAADSIGRRKLGRLEVSSVGLGVQNMSRTYQTTIPRRPISRKCSKAKALIAFWMPLPRDCGAVQFL